MCDLSHSALQYYSPLLIIVYIALRLFGKHSMKKLDESLREILISILELDYITSKLEDGSNSVRLVEYTKHLNHQA